MGNQVEASAQCVRDHLRRTHHPERKLTDTEVGSTVNLTLPAYEPSMDQARLGCQDEMAQMTMTFKTMRMIDHHG